jgi:hypothetical protein
MTSKKHDFVITIGKFKINIIYYSKTMYVYKHAIGEKIFIIPVSHAV